VGGILSWALSWLVVFAVGLAPMLVYFLVRGIGRAIRGVTRRRGSGQGGSDKAPGKGAAENDNAAAPR
jgi:hypothetical protein